MKLTASQLKWVICANGHVRSPENTYVSPDGRRDCQVCRRQRRKAYLKRHDLTWHTVRSHEARRRELRRDRQSRKNRPLVLTAERIATIERYTERQGDCLIWTGKVGKTSGRPKKTVQSKNRLVIHVLWLWYRGPLPKGHDLHHFKCSNTLCVNVEHVKPLSPSEHAKLHAQLRREAS